MSIKEKIVYYYYLIFYTLPECFRNFGKLLSSTEEPNLGESKNSQGHGPIIYNSIIFIITIIIKGKFTLNNYNCTSINI